LFLAVASKAALTLSSTTFANRFEPKIRRSEISFLRQSEHWLLFFAVIPK